jgi:hypothetical protein
MVRSQMLRVGYNLRESVNNYSRTNSFIEYFPFEFNPIFLMANESRDQDLVIQKYENRAHQKLLLEEL